LNKKIPLWLSRTCAVFLPLISWFVFAADSQAGLDPEITDIDHAFARLYNFDFEGTYAIIDKRLQTNGADPLAYALRGATHLFAEYRRLQILQTDFFSDDDQVTDKKKLKPDPAARQIIFAATAESRKRAAAQLSQHPEDRDALFALSMAAGIETEYTLMVEKKYLRGYNLSKENQGYARRLLALNPPCYDAYVTLGSAEYVVANLNFFFRIFAHFDGIKGDRQKAIENLKKAISYGRFYPPYAKLLLAVVYLREKQFDQSLLLLKELENSFPENPLFKDEVERITKKAADAAKKRLRK
jgi:hypothetical protein